MFGKGRKVFCDCYIFYLYIIIKQQVMGILIHTSSFEEQSFLESLLKKMKVSFESTDTDQKVKVSKEQMDSIKKGLDQADKGDFLSNEEVHQEAKNICSK